MKNREILFLSEALTDVNAQDMNFNFNYAISSVLSEALAIAANIRKAIEPNDTMKKYEEALQELREKYVTRDDEGNALTLSINGREIYNIPMINSPKGPFNVEVKKLRVKYQKDIDLYEKQLGHLELENKEFKPMTIKKSQIPNGLSRRAMDAVFLIIDK